jgi:hypothetical protein
LNPGDSNALRTFIVDDTITLQVQGGCLSQCDSIALSVFNADGQQIRNQDQSGAGALPLSISGVVPTQPFNGQWFQLDVVSVAPSNNQF